MKDGFYWVKFHVSWTIGEFLDGRWYFIDNEGGASPSELESDVMGYTVGPKIEPPE